MFLVTQFIGLYIVNHYSTPGKALPYGMETPKIGPVNAITQLIVAFVIAISLLIFLTKLIMKYKLCIEARVAASISLP